MKKLLVISLFLLLNELCYAINLGGGSYSLNLDTVTATGITATNATIESATITTLGVTGVGTFTGIPVFNGGVDINEDFDTDFDAADEEFNLTTSSGGITAAMTIYNSVTDLIDDQHLLSLDLKDNADANGIYLRCRDNSSADTVFKIGPDGAITIDVSGAGSGTVLSEASLIANDAAFRLEGASGIIISTASAVNTLSLATGGVLTSLAGITAGGNVTAVGSVIIGSADMNETDLEKLDGITNGTAAANKCLVVDTNLDIATLGKVTMSTATVTYIIISGDTIEDFAGTNLTVTASALNVDDSFLSNGADDATIYKISIGTLAVTGTGTNCLDLPAQSVAGADLVNDSVTDTQLAYNTGQHLTTTSDVTFDQISTTSNKIAVTSLGQTVYKVFVPTAIADTEEYTVSDANGKAGSFDIKIGTYTATGTFSSAAVVSLGYSSPDVTITNDTDSRVNIYDGGTSIIIENQSGSTATAFIEILYIN